MARDWIKEALSRCRERTLEASAMLALLGRIQDAVTPKYNSSRSISDDFRPAIRHVLEYERRAWVEYLTLALGADKDGGDAARREAARRWIGDGSYIMRQVVGVDGGIPPEIEAEIRAQVARAYGVESVLEEE